jgi:hypothetical protein
MQQEDKMMKKVLAFSVPRTDAPKPFPTHWDVIMNTQNTLLNNP